MLSGRSRHACGFQSTLPVRGATNSLPDPIAKNMISIHAPRAGSDRKSTSVQVDDTEFQSTLPVRGATLGRDL